VIRLVATDLDGTLLRSDGTISARTERALRAARRVGVVIVAVTGRPPRWVEGLHETLGVEPVISCMNGALLLDARTGIELDHQPIAGDTALLLAAALRDALPGVVFACQVRGEFRHEPAYVPAVTVTPSRVGALETLVTGEVTKLIVRHPNLTHEEVVHTARLVVADRAEVTFSGGQIVEISARGVHKGAALLHVASRHGVAIAYTIAFGDAPNDVQMLRTAGVGVAVANAHPEAINAADEVAASNDHDGVARTLERLFG
jgi:hydroxymethylpyrimidine pyrophosphatase-like HAD family hydrolase